MNYFQFHIGDYAAHTKHLSPIEDLAYRRLLDAYYLSERPLNGSSTDVARAIGLREFHDDVSYVLGQFFTRNGDEWINARADSEIAKFIGKQEKASRAGRASAERKLNGRSTDVEQTFNQPITNNQEPITIKKQDQKPLSPSAPSGDKAKGTRLDSSWQLPKAWGEWVLQNLVGWTVETIRQQADMFRDYWSAQPGAKGRKTDWLATWRNWMRKATGTASAGTFRLRDTRPDSQKSNDELAAEMGVRGWI